MVYLKRPVAKGPLAGPEPAEGLFVFGECWRLRVTNLHSWLFHIGVHFGGALLKRPVVVPSNLIG